jgi:hypothetical protein
MSRARSVSQLVGANTALGNTVITGTLSTSTNTATFGTAAYHVANGNLGINTSSPSTGLHVNLPTGNGVVDSVRGIYVSNANNSVGSTAGLGFVFTGSSGGGTPVAGIVAIQQDTTQASADLAFHTRTSSGGGGTYERMRINSNGQITTPYQPAFWARKDDGNHTGDSVVVWNNAFLNRGSHYNTSTGRFTAPVAGVYCFFFRMRQTGSGLNMLWEKNDTAYQWQGTISGDGETAMGNITVQLAAGDTVRVVKYGGGMQGVADYHNLFTGYLIG